MGMMRDENYGIPIIVGDDTKINPIVKSMGGDYNLDGIKIINATTNSNIDKYIDKLYAKLQHKGYLREDCAHMITNNNNVFSACIIEYGNADAMITGTTKNYYNSLDD